MVHCFKMTTIFKASGPGAPFCLATSAAISRVHISSFHKFATTSKHVPRFPQPPMPPGFLRLFHYCSPRLYAATPVLVHSFAPVPARVTRCWEQHSLWDFDFCCRNWEISAASGKPRKISNSVLHVQNLFLSQKVSFRHREGWSG